MRPATRHCAVFRAASLFVMLTALSCSGSEAPATGPSGSVVPDVVDCAVFPAPSLSPYVLPYAIGHGHSVSRTFGHYTPLNRGVGLYAIDFPMPIGTSVHAARAGVVVAVEERFSDADRATFHENWVMIRHGDGTVARYLHLTTKGALVEVGQRVAQGQPIGRSGNSGPTTGPHLHFDIQTCGPNLPPGYNDLPCGMTVPVSFRNTDPHACGLEPPRAYTARPFTADPR
jgi:murein DD-endopeptidase MepM/ murein hydrolase activator NlpD